MASCFGPAFIAPKGQDAACIQTPHASSLVASANVDSSHKVPAAFISPTPARAQESYKANTVPISFAAGDAAAGNAAGGFKNNVVDGRISSAGKKTTTKISRPKHAIAKQSIEPRFLPQAVLAFSVCETLQIKILVAWKGYDTKDSTWEPYASNSHLYVVQRFFDSGTEACKFIRCSCATCSSSSLVAALHQHFNEKKADAATIQASQTQSLKRPRLFLPRAVFSVAYCARDRRCKILIDWFGYLAQEATWEPYASNHHLDVVACFLQKQLRMAFHAKVTDATFSFFAACKCFRCA